MSNEKAKFSKEQKLKITAALLVALSGILAGVVELFSDCCCVKAVDCDLCPIRIGLLIVNVLAVVTALIADILGIIQYSEIGFKGKKAKKCKKIKKSKKYIPDLSCDEEELPNIEDEYYIDDDTDEKKEDKQDDTNTETEKSGDKLFLFSLVSTAVSFAMLCISIIVLAVI